MADVIARFARNRPGRDFVAGDIHGCFDQLEAALERLRFDSDRDRLFTVGDLVDRGPRSAAALEWLARPWFHACLGNHEEMRLAAPDPQTLALWLLLNGGEWWFALGAARDRFTAAFAALPLAMELETAHGRLGIVHADVPEPLSWPAFLAALEAGDPLARETAVWSRQRAEGLVSAPVAGIERVVCGHTISADGRPHAVANVWFIDTGAFLQTEPFALTVLPVSGLFAPAAVPAPAKSQ